MTLHPQSYLAETLGVNNVAICYEQFARKDRGMFVAWPFDVLDARVVAGGTGRAIPRTFEPWVSYEAQMDIYDQLDGGYEAEDFEDDDGDGGPPEGPFGDGASSADTSVDGGYYNRPARMPVPAPAPPPPAWAQQPQPPPPVFDPWQGRW